MAIFPRMDPESVLLLMLLAVAVIFFIAGYYTRRAQQKKIFRQNADELTQGLIRELLDEIKRLEKAKTKEIDLRLDTENNLRAMISEARKLVGKAQKIVEEGESWPTNKEQE